MRVGEKVVSLFHGDFPPFLQEKYLEEKEIDVDYLGALIGVPLLTKIFHFSTLSLSLSLSLSPSQT